MGEVYPRGGVRSTAYLGRVVAPVDGHVVELGGVGLPDGLLADLARRQRVLDVALFVVGRILERLLGHLGRLLRLHAVARRARVRDVVGLVVRDALELGARRPVRVVGRHLLAPLHLPLAVVSCAQTPAVQRRFIRA